MGGEDTGHMNDQVIHRLKDAVPGLLDWGRATVKTIKDPTRPLAEVSELGVVHGGLERDSAVFRISDGASSIIVKQHFDPAVFRREVANITFVSRANGSGPEISWCDESSGLIVMEDLGDRSLAWLWQEQRMGEYAEWTRRAVRLVAEIQALANRDVEPLSKLHGGVALDRADRLPLPEGLSVTLGHVLHVSRGINLDAHDVATLDQVDAALRGAMADFNAERRGFVMCLTPWHVVEKDGAIRFLDFTEPPICGLLGQFNVAWHLFERRDILLSYLTERERLDLPPIDVEEFLRLEDGHLLLESVDWPERYCRDILEGEHTFTNLDGSRPDDYAGAEAGQLEVIRGTAAAHRELSCIAEIIDQHFD